MYSLLRNEARKSPVDPETAQKEKAALQDFFMEMEEKEKGSKGGDRNAIFEEGSKSNKQDLEQDKLKMRNRAEAEKNKGNECMKSKDWSEAIQHYELAVSLDSSFHIAFGNLSQAYIELKSEIYVILEYKDAVQAAGKAIEIEPKFQKGYYRRSKANQGLGNFLEAAKDLKKILQLGEKDDSIQSELNTLIKKHLSDSQKKELENSGLSSTGNQQGGQFKRLQIIEQEDEDEEEQENEQHQSKNDKEISRPTNQSKRTDNKLLDELAKCKQQKEKATNLIKTAMFEDALKILESTLTIFLEEEKEKLLEIEAEILIEYLNLKMTIHSNIALCYVQIDLPKKVITYCNIVLEAFEFKKEVVGIEDTDKSIIEKTLLRKALAYEKSEKFKEAREVHFEVKRINPGNLIAAHGINRCNQYLEDKHVMIDKLNDSNNESNIMTPKNQINPKKVEIQSSHPSNGKKPDTTQPKTEFLEPKNHTEDKLKHDTTTRIKVEEISSKDNKPVHDYETLLRLYESKKTEGNGYFKENQFQKAYDSFTKAIALIDKNHPNIEKQRLVEEEGIVKSLVNSLSNRAMTCVKLKKYYQGIEDSKRVIVLEPQNPKIYHRKYVCEEAIATELMGKRKALKDPELALDILNKEREFLNDCLADLSIVVSHTNEEQYKKGQDQLTSWSIQLEREAKEYKDQIARLKDLQKKGTHTSPKIVEIHETISEQVPSESQTFQSKPKDIAPKKTQIDSSSLNIDQITLKALEEIINSPNLPNNPSKFEVDLKSFKTYYDKMWSYFTRFESLDFLAKLYSKREMDASIAGQILGCFWHVINKE